MSDDIHPIHFPKADIHPKAWGTETWIINNAKYCAKILSFGAGKSFSDHYHWMKEETWYVVSGQLILRYYDLVTATRFERTLNPGDIIHVPPGNPHQLVAITDAVIWETSTHHEDGDSYRIGKGSSQGGVADLLCGPDAATEWVSRNVHYAKDLHATPIYTTNPGLSIDHTKVVNTGDPACISTVRWDGIWR